MIKSYFGLKTTPFIIDTKKTILLKHQQRHLDILKVHTQHGGLCVILGEPGTGKSILKNALTELDPNQTITLVINRSLHTWRNILRLLCQALELEATGNDSKCETALINEARKLNNKGKTILIIIDDAHLIPIKALRNLRLLLEDFPKNHNLVLIGQPDLNTTLQLNINYDIKSRITYSARLDLLNAQNIKDFIHTQLDRAGLPHATFTEAGINLIIRSSGGTLRAVKNLCVGALIEAVRDQTRTVDLKQINAVLMQPHWRQNQQNEPEQPVVFTNQAPTPPAQVKQNKTT
jgi:type II secretory pathway predicted ATPase ExeA